MSRGRAVAVGLCAAVVLAGADRPARAQGDAPPAAAAGDEEQRRVAAREHFERGLQLVADQAWAPGLAEFLQSRRLYPTRVATMNAAVSLTRLQRFDEALEMYEALLREFPGQPAADQQAVARSITELRALVGTIELDAAEPGAAIVVDGRSRGEYPLPAPLRVGAGTHLVRVYKEGFVPFETRVDVAGGTTARVIARLAALKEAGQLKVSERSGRALDVVLDNVVVGRTPWEGSVSLGDHTVLLRGPGGLGTQPASAPVRLRQTTTLSLTAEQLDASLRVDPTPTSASVALDGVTVGRGAWEGPLRRGRHTVEITADGFLPVRRTITLAPGAPAILGVELERDLDAAMWRKPARLAFELTGALAATPSLGGAASERCGDGCTRGFGLGGLVAAHAAYELGVGVGLGVVAGYVAARQRVQERSAELRPVGLPPRPGTSVDAVTVSGPLLGATGAYDFGERAPIQIRLGAGAVLAAVEDERTGRFGSDDGVAYQTTLASVSAQTISVFVAPEARARLKLAERLEALAGLGALVIIATEVPRWDAAKEVDAASDGIARYPAEPITSRVLVLVTPNVGVRYVF